MSLPPDATPPPNPSEPDDPHGLKGILYAIEKRYLRLRGVVESRGMWSGNISLLVMLLALGVLIHKSQLPDPLSNPLAVIVPLLAAAALWFPRSVPVGVLLLGGVFLELAVALPFITNHSGFLLLIIAATLIVAWRRSRADGSEQEPMAGLEEGLFPLIRGCVYVLWFFAVLHKLNHHFFDPVGSCAVAQYLQLHERLPFLPDADPAWGRYSLIGLTLATEAAIPALLFSRSTRVFGLAIALGFHFVMGVAGHQAFSGLAPALYVAFLPPGANDELGGRGARLDRLGSYLLPVLGTGIAGLLLLGGMVDRYYLAFELGIGTLVILYILIVAAAVRGWSGRSSTEARGMPEPPRSAIPPTWLSAALVVLLLLSGSSPYLGLKTEYSFAMYSNLRTEHTEWNHLFLPEAMRIFALQDTLIHVEAVSGGGLEDGETELVRLLQSRDRSVPLEARRVVDRACAVAEGPVAARFRIQPMSGDAARLVDTGDLCGERPLGGPDPWWMQKLLRFRPRPLANVCRH